MTDTALTLRTAAATDAPALAQLTEELGYRADAEILRQRLALLAERPDHAVFVAERGDAPSEPTSGLAGWIHVGRVISLEGGAAAEILGLVVGSIARRAGVGRQLVQCAERWARGQGLERIVVRSNALRAEAHFFYPALDYVLAKTQRVYVKPLGQ
ncbi:MAG: GNAT family N-acetyltransferase [Steroidobacteraceae bacterium]